MMPDPEHRTPTRLSRRGFLHGLLDLFGECLGIFEPDGSQNHGRGRGDHQGDVLVSQDAEG